MCASVQHALMTTNIRVMRTLSFYRCSSLVKDAHQPVTHLRMMSAVRQRLLCFVFLSVCVCSMETINNQATLVISVLKLEDCSAPPTLGFLLLFQLYAN